MKELNEYAKDQLKKMVGKRQPKNIFSFRFNVELSKKVRHICEEHSITITSFIENALREYLKKWRQEG